MCFYHQEHWSILQIKVYLHHVINKKQIHHEKDLPVIRIDAALMPLFLHTVGSTERGGSNRRMRGVEHTACIHKQRNKEN